MMNSSLVSVRTSRISLVFAVGTALFLTLPRLSFGITSGQIDTFQNGTTDGWGDPAGNSSNSLSGGPAGAGDAYMQVVSGTFGGGRRMVVINDLQWLGNYVAAGVSGVSMDLRNFGASAIPIRIAIRESSADGSSTPGYSSTTAFNLPADGLWHSASFSLAAASLTPINSPQPLSTDLANVQDFRILSSTLPATIGSTISAKIGVDNILAVPEPGTISLLGAGIFGIGMMMRRRVGRWPFGF